MATAVGQVGQIDRAKCRAAAQEHFSMQRMARDYARLYRRILEDPSGTAVRHAASSRGQGHSHGTPGRYASNNATLPAEAC